MIDKVPMTPSGYRSLVEELKTLKAVDRPAIVEAIAEARAHGDLSENAEYHAARERQSFIEGRIKELDGVVAAAEILDPATLSGTTVKFGASVLLVDEQTEEESRFTLVGHYETNTERGYISINSPVARALIGKAVGDSVEVHTPKGRRSFEILEVAFPV